MEAKKNHLWKAIQKENPKKPYDTNQNHVRKTHDNSNSKIDLIFHDLNPKREGKDHRKNEEEDYDA